MEPQWKCPFWFVKTFFEGEKPMDLPKWLNADDISAILDSDNPHQHKLLQVYISKAFIKYLSEYIQIKIAIRKTIAIEPINRSRQKDRQSIFVYILNQFEKEVIDRYPQFTKHEDPRLLHHAYQYSRKNGTRAFLGSKIEIPFQAIMQWFMPLLNVTLAFIQYLVEHQNIQTIDLEKITVPKFMIETASLWNQYSWIIKSYINDMWWLQNSLNPEDHYAFTKKFKQYVVQEIQLHRLSIHLWKEIPKDSELPDAPIFWCPAIPELKYFMIYIILAAQKYTNIK
jgi:hypothetical protein